jgi:hypothetical protein
MQHSGIVLNSALPSTDVRRIFLLARPYLSPAIAVLFALIVLWRGLPAAYDAYTAGAGTGGDLGYLLDASELVTSSGESKTLYGPGPVGLDQTQYKAIYGHEYPYYYPYAPAFAFAMSPLTTVSRATAFDLWRAGVAMCTAVLAYLVASSFRSWAWRLAMVAAIVCWDPLLLNARIGQAGALIAAATAVAVVVFLRHRNAGAALMGLLALKPTAAIGPALIAFSEKGRVWLVFLATAVIAVMVPFLYFGPSAVLDWLDILSTRGASDLGGAARYNQGLNSLLGRTEVVSFLLLALLIGGVLLSEKVRENLGLCAGASFALFASLLLNPHGLIYDWGVAFAGIMLLRRSKLLGEDTSDLAFGLLGLSLFAAGQLAWHLTFHDYVVRPLTAWTLVITVLLLAVTFSHTLRGRLNLNTDEKPVDI